MAILPSMKEREADDMRLRVQSFCGKKTDRAVEKGMITKEEADKVFNAVGKLFYKFKNDWWIDQKGHKSYEILMLLFEQAEGDFASHIEILQKIEKA